MDFAFLFKVKLIYYFKIYYRNDFIDFIKKILCVLEYEYDKFHCD